jgi:hypothetical protein
MRSRTALVQALMAARAQAQSDGMGEEVQLRAARTNVSDNAPHVPDPTLSAGVGVLIGHCRYVSANSRPAADEETSAGLHKVAREPISLERWRTPHD